MRKELIFSLAVLMVLIFAGCPPSNPDFGRPAATTGGTDEQIAQPAPVEMGSAKITITFFPQVGTYQGTVTGDVALKAPLTNTRVEIYTKTNNNKKVIAASKLGNITADEKVNIEVLLSSNRLTYKIGEDADSIQNGLPESQKHALGIDVFAENFTENWESLPFTFDDSDAYQALKEQN